MRSNRFDGMDPEQARSFAASWLPTWTGNQPERLASFYAEDAFYSDPALPHGVRGRDALLAYFRTLLARNPRWVWTHTGSIPLRDGFLNKWHASIPIGDDSVQVDGVCTVQLREGLIYSNEVFFDSTPLARALAGRGGRPGPGRGAAARPSTRWELIRDVLVFQVKLTLDALRDVVFGPVSLVAGVVDLVTGGERPGRRYYAVLRAGRRTERLINLFGQAAHVAPEASDSGSGASVDAVVGRLERILVEQYERGGVTASAKTAIDRCLDAIGRRRAS